MLRFEEIALGEYGSPRCRRCRSAGAETIRDDAAIIEDIHRAAGSWSGGPGPNLAFCGIEPFRHPQLAGILAAAVEVGAKRIRLDSDATALGALDASRLAIDAGVRHLQFDLRGSTASLHDPLAGGAEAFDGALRGVAEFGRVAEGSGTAIQISARIPVCPHNLQDLPGIVGTASKAGVSLIRLVIEEPKLNLRTAAPWIEAACDTGIVHATWVGVEGVPFCAADGWELHLASVYRPTAGEKAELCSACPLDAWCGGATFGAGRSIAALFRPPPEAQRLAACVNRGFSPPVVGAHG